jgi:hypothetical protein
MGKLVKIFKSDVVIYITFFDYSMQPGSSVVKLFLSVIYEFS